MVGACGFSAVNIGDGGPPDDSVIIDTMPDAEISTGCTAAGTTCVGPDERLRECAAINASPVDTVCAWRCVDAPTPHCRKLQPAGGGVQPGDMEPTTGLGNLSISNAFPIRFNTDTGTISIGGFPVTQTGFQFKLNNGIAIWRAQNIDLQGVIEIRGANPAALVSLTEIQIRGLIDLQGDCSGTNAGPGGGLGGEGAQVGVGSGGGGAGIGVDTACTGGGGGGHAALGGVGGGSTAAGAVFGAKTVMILDGGGGGGGGGGPGGGGGGGGGALQLVANGKVRVDGLGIGGIHAGGCGGRSGSCGGGGGAGGTILIEAAVVELLNGNFTVNGGGGGGGKYGIGGTSAHNSQQRAAGGAGGTNGSGADGGGGGDGGDESVFTGEAGVTATRSGGGGGAVGWIRFNTMTGVVMTQNILLSPILSTGQAQTSVSAGSASLQ